MRALLSVVAAAALFGFMMAMPPNGLFGGLDEWVGQAAILTGAGLALASVLLRPATLSAARRTHRLRSRSR